MEEIILVDEFDNVIGFEEKLQAHRNGGKLHRAFSIFIFNASGRMLIQRRSMDKYHFPGRWANACCSHPRKGEHLAEATHRRLTEELGFDTELEEAFAFRYKASDPESGLSEHEYDHVFVGEFDGAPQPCPHEVADWKWIDCRELERDLAENPEHYAPWFAIAFARLKTHR